MKQAIGLTDKLAKLQRNCKIKINCLDGTHPRLMLTD